MPTFAKLVTQDPKKIESLQGCAQKWINDPTFFWGSNAFHLRDDNSGVAQVWCHDGIVSLFFNLNGDQWSFEKIEGPEFSKAWVMREHLNNSEGAAS